MKGRLLIVLGFLLVIGSIALVAYNMNLSIEAQESSSAVLEYIDSNQGQDEDSDWNYDNESYSMVIEIPSIGVRLPVIKEYSYEKLNIAPCVYSGSIFTDNLVICGHNYRSQLGSLNKVLEGDIVTIKTPNGVEYTYRIAGLEVLEPFATEEMTESKAALTIFTCTWGGKTRYTVRCTKELER